MQMSRDLIQFYLTVVAAYLSLRSLLLTSCLPSGHHDGDHTPGPLSADHPGVGVRSPQ